MSSQPVHHTVPPQAVDTAMNPNLNYPPQTFSSLLHSSNTRSHPQAALHQHMQRLHAMMMAQRQQQQQQQQQQQPMPAALPHQAQPAPFTFNFPQPMPFFGSLGSAALEGNAALEANAALRPAAGDASGSSSMRALPAQLQNLSTWQHMSGGMAHTPASAAPFIEGMLKKWSQSLMAAAATAPCHMSAHATSAAAARAVYHPPRKLKKSATAEKKATKQRKSGGEGEPDAVAAGAAPCKLKLDGDADGSALDVLSAAVDSQQGDRDDASLNAATALHAMLGCWQPQDDALPPGVFALQQLSPRLSKKRNRSLLKELAVDTADALDDDCMALTPCSKGRTSKQLDSAYNHTTNPEHVCRTKDGSPVVDVHVPAVCECGSIVVGVWYSSYP
jgi:hypothetical protein